MYLRGVHAETNLKVLRQLVRDNPLGLLTTAISSPSFPLLQSSHIPFILQVDDETSDTELGHLRGHLARQNPQSKAMIEEATAKQTQVLENEVLVVFTHAAHHYVTPKFYTETKPATGKVVPTWNYAAVQVYGKATVYVDSRAQETADFLGGQMAALTQHTETNIMGYKKPWEVSDAPEKFIDLLKKAVIGIDIRIDRMEGKFKMSQEMGSGDSEGVEEGFKNLGTEAGDAVADMVKQRRK